jgi:hypothetical protein
MFMFLILLGRSGIPIGIDGQHKIWSSSKNMVGSMNFITTNEKMIS